ncbi:hypothetical protein LCGC14_1408640 [marine sediment metagenome]|uniref:Fibronectin type-III domain-containing protein n=1 Tax=marine sediment metagenome TaxID=412755 RepID=A0A0F9JV82_9ZZZZ
MATEVLTTYTETDPNSKIAVTTSRATWTSLARNEDAYVYFDKGVAFFDGDFVIEFDLHTILSETDAQFVWCALANVVDDFRGIEINSEDMQGVRFSRPAAAGASFRAILTEIDGGTRREATVITLTHLTNYYLKFYRDESVGTFGTIYLVVYSDAARTVIVSSVALGLATSKKDFRYIYAIMSANQGTTKATSGWTQNFEISTTIATALQVSTQAMTVITATTATGNGAIDDTGISSVTAHGHAWNTSVDPVTGDNNVDNGAGSLGVFTSSITGLLDGQKYYVRAYATNTEGTVYGANVVFTSGVGGGGTQLIPGNLSVVQNRLHWVGHDDGRERFIEGTLVP